MCCVGVSLWPWYMGYFGVRCGMGSKSSQQMFVWRTAGLGDRCCWWANALPPYLRPQGEMRAFLLQDNIRHTPLSNMSRCTHVCVRGGVIHYLSPLLTAKWVSDMKKQTCYHTRRLCKPSAIADGCFCVPSCACDLEERHTVYIYTADGKSAGTSVCTKITTPVCSNGRVRK